MKKVIGFLSILFLAICMIACSSNSTPTAVVKEYAKCLKNKDYNGIANLFYYDSSDAEKAAESKKMITSILSDKVNSEIEKMGGIESYEIGTEVISEDGESAVVNLTFTYGNGETEDEKSELDYIDGKWYLSTGK